MNVGKQTLFCIITILMCASTLGAMQVMDVFGFEELPFAFNGRYFQSSSKKIIKLAKAYLHRKEKLRRCVPTYFIESRNADFNEREFLSSELVIKALQKIELISEKQSKNLFRERYHVGSYNDQIVKIYHGMQGSDGTMHKGKLLFVLKYYHDNEHTQATDEERISNPDTQGLSSIHVFQERIEVYTKSVLGRLATDCMWNDILLSAREKQLAAYVPKMAQTECFILYKGKEEQLCCIEVMHAAQGLSIDEFFWANTTQPSNVVFDAVAVVGKALSAAHQLCAVLGTLNDDPAAIRTQLHGDFYSANIFVDPPSKIHPGWEVWFIDCESVALSCNSPQPIDRDIVTFIMHQAVLTRILLQKSERITYFCQNMQVFLRSYIELYPLQMQAPLAQYIKEFLGRRFENIITIIGYVMHGCRETIGDTCKKLTKYAVGGDRSVYSWQEEALLEEACRSLMTYKNEKKEESIINFKQSFELLKKACEEALDF